VWVAAVVDDLGVREETQYVKVILQEGTSADRQIRVYRETGDFKAVVDHVIAETTRVAG
jgi:carboxylate-amine ligase